MKTNILPYAHMNAIIANSKEPVLHAVETMSEFNIRHLPLVDDIIKLEGIVTAVDIIKLMYEVGDESFLQMKLKDVMTDYIITADPHAKLLDSFLTMAFSNISGLPIVENYEIIGMLTVRDIIRIDRLWKDIDSMSITPYEGIGEKILINNMVTMDHSIWQILDLMQEINIRQVLVKNTEGLVEKVISQLDIFGQILQEQKHRRFTFEYFHQTAASEIYTTIPKSLQVPVKLKDVRKAIIESHEEVILLKSQGKTVKTISEYDLFRFLALYYQKKYNIQVMDQ